MARCLHQGRVKSSDLIHGVDVRNGTYAAEYVSKWGLEEEVTKGHLKKGLNGSLTPFDLLRVLVLIIILKRCLSSLRTYSRASSS